MIGRPHATLRQHLRVLTEVGSDRDDRQVDERLDPREDARNRRRDRDAEAEARDLLRPGMGKVFKQIQDAQRKAADEPPPRSPGTPRSTAKPTKR